tara:strand:- start:5410 stop:5586 length:177 start_codon:yes stop_codon:yes gene_type:complete
MKAKDTFDEQIQKADAELETVSASINELATRQQRLFGYRQCLIDLKEYNATSKNSSTS